MSKKKKRGLTQDDITVWRHVADGVKPLHETPRFDISEEKSIQALKSSGATRKYRIERPFRIGEKASQTSSSQAPDFKNAPAKTSPNMDKRNFQRLIKGKMEIEGTLDLHGHTADRAKAELIRYLKTSHAMGRRMILVITGKGRTHGVDEFNRPKGGVLRQSLPDWLRGPAVSHLVLQVTPAQQRHGGGGAWYVYLRRKR